MPTSPSGPDLTRSTGNLIGTLPRGRSRVKIRATDEVTSPLPAADLFELLADPRGCITWHEHPSVARPASIEAPDGPALRGATYTSRGMIGKIECLTTTTVTAAERPRFYETSSHTTFGHPRAPALDSKERFVLEDRPSGSLVRYETNITRDFSSLDILSRGYMELLNLINAGRAERGLRKCFRDVLAAAEREVQRRRAQ